MNVAGSDDCADSRSGFYDHGVGKRDWRPRQRRR